MSELEQAIQPFFFKRRLKSVWVFMVFLWKTIIGGFFCSVLLFSVMPLGWCLRLMQRSACKQWWKYGRHGTDETFEQFTQQSSVTVGFERFPNWFVGTSLRQELEKLPRFAGWLSHARVYIKYPFMSLFKNIQHGFLGWVNVFVVTFPAVALWLFSWHAGWNNSFYKVYEQSHIGPLTGILGIILFIPVAVYIPMAQARQGVTGNWRAFYEFGLVWRLMRLRWWSVIGLSLLFSLFSLPVVLLKSAPMFFTQMFPELASVSPAEAQDILQRHFFRLSVLGFLFFVALRILAARIYAGAVLKGVKKGVVLPAELAPFERDTLGRLNLLETEREGEAGVGEALSAWTLKPASLVVGLVLLGVIWFSFVAQIYVSEFLSYHPVIGWGNQPLIQLPYFNYTPWEMGQGE